MTFDERREANAYTNQVLPSAVISNVVVNGGGLVNKSRGEIVDVNFQLKNTSSFPTAFDMALEFDTTIDGQHYDKFFDGVDSVVIDPGLVAAYNLWFTVPNDAPLNQYFSIGVYAYPIGKFNANDPQADYVAKESVFDVIYVS